MPGTDEISARQAIINWLEEAKFFGVYDPHVIKRTQVRFEWTRPMEMMVDGKMHYIYSRDINEEGIGLTCRERLHDHSRVHIRRDSNDPWVPARVAHCTQTVGAFKIGIQLVFDLDAIG